MKFKLSKRTARLLAKTGIENKHEARNAADSDLLRIDGFGRKSLHETRLWTGQIQISKPSAATVIKLERWAKENLPNINGNGVTTRLDNLMHQAQLLRSCEKKLEALENSDRVTVEESKRLKLRADESDRLRRAAEVALQDLKLNQFRRVETEILRPLNIGSMSGVVEYVTLLREDIERKNKKIEALESAKDRPDMK